MKWVRGDEVWDGASGAAVPAGYAAGGDRPILIFLQLKT